MLLPLVAITITAFEGVGVGVGVAPPVTVNAAVSVTVPTVTEMVCAPETVLDGMVTTLEKLPPVVVLLSPDFGVSVVLSSLKMTG
jgi:hypothetical protein